MFQSQPQDPSPQNQRRRQMLLLALFALGVLILGRTGFLDDGGFLGGGLGSTGASAVRYQAIRDAGDLERVFGTAGYDLPAVAAGDAPAPQLFVDRLPPGWAALPPADRQRLFIAAMLPPILSVNAQLNGLRDRLATVADARDAAALSDAELALVADLSAVLASDAGAPEAARAAATADPVATARRLAARIGPLPVALTLAQAAQDSDWGVQAGAMGGRVLPAEPGYDPAGPFASPYRPPGRMSGAADGAAAGPPGLWTQLMARAMALAFAPGHAEFRTLREEMEAAHEPLRGAALAAALAGDGAGDALQAIVATHGLAGYDTARLDRPPALVLVHRPGKSNRSEPSG